MAIDSLLEHIMVSVISASMCVQSYCFQAGVGPVLVLVMCVPEGYCNVSDTCLLVLIICYI